MLNLPAIKAEVRLEKLFEKVLNADTVYKLVLLATDNEEKAAEAYTAWTEAQADRGAGAKDFALTDMNFVT